MKKRIITLFSILIITPCTFFATTSCTFEDIFDHVTEEQKKLDKGKNNDGGEIREENYDFVITPQNVTGDFRKFFQSIADKHSNILIKDGTYDIELVNGDGVKPKDGSTITFEKNAKIIVKPNSLDVYCLIDLRGRKNITLNNPNLEGDKDKHLTSTGEWCYGINVAECSNIIINNAKISKFWGDGISIRNCSNVKIYKPVIDNNRRQGISITSCENVEIHDPIISNTTGTYPAFGIDVEPNFNGEHVKGLKIYNAIFRNNGTKEGSEYPAGFCLSTHMIGKALLPSNKELVSTYFDIELINPTFYGDALLVSTPTDFVHGKLVVKNPIFHNTRETSLYFFNHQSYNFKTEILNPIMYNSVQRETPSIYYTPILFWCFSDRTTKTTGTQNITIANPKIIADDTAKYKASVINNITNSSFTDDMKNVIIENITQEGYDATLTNHNGNNDRNLNQRLATFSNLDKTFTLSINPKSSKLPKIKSGIEVSKTLNNAIGDFRENIKDPIIYLNDNIPISGFKLYYVNNSANKMPLSLNFGTKSAPKRKIVKRADQVQHSSSGITIPHGSHVTLVKRGSNIWEIVDTKSSKNIRY
ncbi:hypothetical protein CAPN001_22620 [Capnocytophaga stomatis]|uniref:right-handed parallel beta-helix repeat-containing protein n=1 Tax=Capnocytophaga stomatis TaxID=1848904 RepID=UPI0019500D6E|nr:right-handed parallel beta-helix repeat-containing protein [Capnocytophaga stomatis]GIJ97693.1 hypothetical protein CAPN001_22620 [Capnocytophaga stomatis]GIM48690.1 hypothetical protein CAPN003_01420 [Capnocytophaga stomatis]